MQEPFKSCPACGAQTDLSALFCQSCGARYDVTPAPTRKRSQALTVSMILVVAVFGCCATAAVIEGIRVRRIAPSANTPVSTPDTSKPLWSPTPDLPPDELLARAKALLAQPYDESAYIGAIDLLNRIPPEAKQYKESVPLKQKATKARERGGRR